MTPLLRAVITGACSCILAGIIIRLLLPVLHALKAGQSVRDIGPTWHNNKAGTPLMGALWDFWMISARSNTSGIWG